MNSALLLWTASIFTSNSCFSFSQCIELCSFHQKSNNNYQFVREKKNNKTPQQLRASKLWVRLLQHKMALLFSLKKVLSLEISNFHDNKKRVQALSYAASWDCCEGPRGRTHGQKCQAKDRLRGRAVQQASKPQVWGSACALGSWLTQMTASKKRPWPRAIGCFTAAKK